MVNNKNTQEFEKITKEDALSEFGTDIKVGLDSSKAKVLLDKYGYNELSSKTESFTKRLLKRFWGPIPWMIEVAAILSAIVHKWEDFSIIMVLLLTNVIIDLWQESKALNALEVLKNKLAQKAVVLREGKFETIEAKELVPGDIIKVRIGAVLPADVKILESEYIQLDQSSLTGESLPVTKHEGGVGYANSVVKKGEALALVVNTGVHTYFGKTASLVEKAQNNKVSHFQKAVVHIGNYLIIISLFLAVLIIISAIYRGENLINIIRFVLVLSVAAIPVALPAVLSVTMVVGAMNLAKKKAIVSHLVAIEELAGVDILCADKTGTLTKNEMKVGDSLTYGDYDLNKLILYAVLASRKEDNDPLEKAIFEKFDNLDGEANTKDFQLTKYIPFDPVSKRTQSTCKFENKNYIYTKGAVQVVASLCKESDAELKGIYDKVEEFATKGFRTLAVATREENEEHFHFVGIIPLYDPPRDDSNAVIAEARKLGIEVKMITGDNISIAKQIAKTLDIGNNIYDINEVKESSGEEEYLVLTNVIAKNLYTKLSSENVSESSVDEFAKKVVKDVKDTLSESNLPKGHVKKHESEIIEIIQSANGFAQVFPEDKYFIVDSLQKGDHILAMTGDGVNDAPALKKADCGIAVSGATDAARAAADIILTLPGLSVIVDAIVQARITFERMKSYTIYRITETMRIILFMTLAIVIFNFYPVTAIMIIILALLNDIPILTIAYDNTDTDSKPVKWNMKEILEISTILGITGVLSTFLFYFIVNSYFHFSQNVVMSLIFLKLLIAGHLTIFVARTKKAFWRKPYPAGSLLWSTVGTKIFGTLLAVYGIFIPAIGWKLAGIAWGYAFLEFFLMDLVKIVVYKFHFTKE